MTVRDDLHHLVDQLDEDAAIEALAYLQSLSLPASMRAAARDEPESEDDWAAVVEADAADATWGPTHDERQE